MRLRDGKWECAYCGAPIDVPEDALPHVVFKDSPEQPDYRVVFVRGEEVHRCHIEPGDDATTPIP